MNWKQLVDAVSGASILALRLAANGRVGEAVALIGTNVKNYNEVAGRSLPGKNPIRYVFDQGWNAENYEDRITMPNVLGDGGGTGLDERLILAHVTRNLRPNKVFEIGTFKGLTTSTFALNLPENGRVYTLDLPQDTSLEEEKRTSYISTDAALTEERKKDDFIVKSGVSGLCHRLFCDSMSFNPEPFRDCIQLGFIDGAHTLEYVRNDTEKMAVMMDEKGLVFWHDYGGRGHFRDLSEYLESLNKIASIYRFPGTSLAWAPASSIKHLAD